MSTVPGARTVSSHRVRDVDALRVGACLSLFPYHAARVYDANPVYHVKSTVPAWWADALVAVMQPWLMPVFFACAGWATLTALRRRPPLTLRRRIARLGLPLLAGCLAFAPAIKYIERLGPLDLQPAGPRVAAPITLSFAEFLPFFFRRLNWFTWSHLWYLAYLLVFTCVGWSLLVRLARADARHQGEGDAAGVPGVGETGEPAPRCGRLRWRWRPVRSCSGQPGPTTRTSTRTGPTWSHTAASSSGGRGWQRFRAQRRPSGDGGAGC